MKNKDEPHFYGGQAVMEGVVMKGKTLYSMAVRKPDGDIAVVTRPIKEQKRRFLKLPVIRGIMAFVAALTMGMKTLTESAEIASEGEPAEELSRFEQFLQNKFGDKINDILIQVSVVLAIMLAVLLFILLPLWIGSAFSFFTGAHPSLLGVVEGVARLLIFLGYVFLISRSKDIQRVFQYHGAEHKTINTHEQGAELTIENVQKHSRLHNRCGTSFLLIVMFISIAVFTFLRVTNPWLRILSRIALIPVIAGVSYEVIKWAGRSKSPFVRVVSYPGLLLQRLTTGEPDDKQVEVAIVALQNVLTAENELEPSTSA
jgi:uncharacterized protein YqhQ